MSSTYRIHADALDENFLASLKTLYKGRTIDISVEAEQDETERIYANPALKAKLDAALQNIEAGHVIEFSAEGFEKYAEAMLSGENPDYRQYAEKFPETDTESHRTFATTA